MCLRTVTIVIVVSGSDRMNITTTINDYVQKTSYTPPTFLVFRIVIKYIFSRAVYYSAVYASDCIGIYYIQPVYHVYSVSRGLIE